MLWGLCTTQAKIIVAKKTRQQMSNIEKTKDSEALYVHIPHGLVAVFWNSTIWWMSRTQVAKITTHVAKDHNAVVKDYFCILY